MTEDDKDRSGYYQSIARAFLERRGAPFLLSPRDQALIATWEARRIPLRVVLEAVTRTFDDLRRRGQPSRGVPLGRCERQVDEAFAQHRDRGAGGRASGAASIKAAKPGRVREEIEKALQGPAAGDRGIAALLRAALTAINAPSGPDEAALERIEAGIEELLWTGATDAEKATAAAEARREFRGRPAAQIDAAARRLVVKAARATRRVPHVSFYYH
jgi:hypothetical protein